jgi:hypothetical protein
MANALITAKEFADAGDEAVLIFDGAGVRWIPQLTSVEHKYHRLLEDVRHLIAGACVYCSRAYGVKDEIEASHFPLLDEFRGHPSIHRLVKEGYEIITLQSPRTVHKRAAGASRFTHSPRLAAARSADDRRGLGLDWRPRQRLSKRRRADAAARSGASAFAPPQAATPFDAISRGIRCGSSDAVDVLPRPSSSHTSSAATQLHESASPKARRQGSRGPRLPLSAPALLVVPADEGPPPIRAYHPRMIP